MGSNFSVNNDAKPIYPVFAGKETKMDNTIFILTGISLLLSLIFRILMNEAVYDDSDSPRFKYNFFSFIWGVTIIPASIPCTFYLGGKSLYHSHTLMVIAIDFFALIFLVPMVKSTFITRWRKEFRTMLNIGIAQFGKIFGILIYSFFMGWVTGRYIMPIFFESYPLYDLTMYGIWYGSFLGVVFESFRVALKTILIFTRGDTEIW